MTEFIYEKVIDLDAWRLGRTTASRTTVHDNNELGGEFWSFDETSIGELIRRLVDRNPQVLENHVDIFVGVQTSANDVYIVNVESESDGIVSFEDCEGTTRTIEAAILVPLLHKETVQAYSLIEANTHLLFPYHIVNGSAVAYTPQELQERFPLAWDYLKGFREELGARSLVPANPANQWYRFGRAQSLAEMSEPKLIVQVMAVEPLYALSLDGAYVTGGGNGGPYYLLRPKRATWMSLEMLMAILHHPVIEFLVRRKARQFRGDYYSHNKQSLAPLPVPAIDVSLPENEKLISDIESSVRDLIEMSDALATAVPSQRATLLDAIESVRLTLEQLVWKAFNMDDVEWNNSILERRRS